MKYMLLFFTTHLFLSGLSPQKADVTRIENFDFKQDSTQKFNHKTWDYLLKKHVSAHGHVDYNAFKLDQELLNTYILELSRNMPNENWDNTNKLAYWINAYNALTIDLILSHYPITSIKNIKNPWKQRLWKLGKKWYSLDEIEHQILRKMDEPRIHFAIVCASISCPKLQNEAFTASNLNKQLNKSTKAFLSDSQKNNISPTNLKLSKIFKWFAKDFKTNGGVINFINTYTDTKISDKAHITYKDYNWNLNE